MLMASEIANFSSEVCGGGGTGGYNGLVDGDEGDDVTIDYDLFLNILGEEETPDPSQTCPSYSMVEGAPERGSVMGSGRHIELPLQTDAFQGLPVENIDLVTAEHGSPSEYSSETKECGGTHPCTYPTEIFPVEANLASSSGSSGYAGFSQTSEFTGLDHYADMVPSYGAFSNVSADMTQPLPIGDRMLDYARHEVADLQPAVHFSDHSNISESQLGGFETFVSEASSYFDNGFPTPARSDNLNNYGNSSVDSMSDQCILPSLVGKSFVPTSLPSPLRYELFEEVKHGGNSSYDYEDRGMAGNFEFLIPENNVLPDMRRKDHKAHLSNRADQSPCMDGISTCLTLGPSGNSLSAVMPPASHLLSFINNEEDGKTQMITMSSDSRTWDHEERNTDFQNCIMCDDDDDDDICILEDISHPGAITSLAGRLFKEASHAVIANDALKQMDNNVSRMTLTDERQILRAILLDMSHPKTESVPPDGCLEMELLRHQRIALSWMVQKETASWPCCGGILADDQGLGKTVSTIALILAERQPSSEISSDTGKVEAETFDVDEDENQSSSLMSKKDESYPVKSEIDDRTDKVCPLKKGRPAAGTLIVCPTSLIRQWAEEFRSKVTPKANVKVLIYHGSNRTKDPYELAKYDVVITTYSIVSMEVPKLALHDKDYDNKKYLGPDSMHPSPKSKKRKYPPSSSKRSSEKGIGSSSHKPFPPALSRVNWFRVVLDEAQSIKNHRTRAAQACWGLRAKRRWCLSGTPIQNAVDDLYSYFRFLRFEPYAVYKTFCSKIKVPIKESPSKGYRKLQTVLKMIMLRRTKGMLLDGEPIIKLPPKFVQLKKVEFSTEERNFYSKLEADSRAQFQVYAATGTIQQNYVNILLMLLRLRQACDHPLLVQGHDYSAIWKASLETGKLLPREKLIYLLNCLGASLAICGICHDPPEDAVVSICGHVFCSQCICEHLSCENSQCPEVNCKFSLNISAIFSEANLKCCLSDESSEDSPVQGSGSSSSQAVKTEPWLRDHYFQSSKLKAALLLLSSLSQPQDSIVNIDSVESNNNVGGSLTSSRCNNDGRVPSSGSEWDTQPESQSSSGKAIVFSQWTKMLDLLEECLKGSPIQYRRLDGTMSVAARDKAVRDFNTLPEVSVMIMSLKAASLGLNMVVACRVILLDLWWNPTTEDQAIDRAHRIGQTRPVTVFRLTVKDTVEDRILALQQKKREMVSSAFGEDELGSSQTRLTADDLNYLFG